MASRERPTSAFDSGPEDDQSAPTPAELAEVAEAEAAAAEAEAHAAAARAHAMRLRFKAAGGTDASDLPARVGAASQRRLDRSRSTTAAIALGITVLCASLAASGYLLWHHRVVAQERQRTAEFTAVARQAVTTLMSLDSKKTEQDMQRIADIATGPFRDAFPAVADQLTKRLQASKVVTKATVNEVAVESLTGNSSAIVLVAATTEASEAKTADATQLTQSWHIALGLTMDGGRPKVSNIEFVE